MVAGNDAKTGRWNELEIHVASRDLFWHSCILATSPTTVRNRSVQLKRLICAFPPRGQEHSEHPETGAGLVRRRPAVTKTLT